VSTLAPVRVFARDWVYFKRIWRAVLIGSVLQPMMYLLGVGLGVGALVDAGADSAELLGGVSYAAFYATAVIATTAMFVCGQEALWPTMDGFTWSNAYRSMIATPIEPRDVAFGLMLHYGLRALVSTTGVVVVLLMFDETRTLGLLAAIPVGVLTGWSFAMPFAAWTATRQTDSSFPGIIRFGIIPMFLFGGAFYPIEQLPGWLQPVAWFTPLWHGVELCRGVVLGGLGAAMAVVHVTALCVFVAGGLVACTITFERRLRV
jgi:lipooligosaccharide transport system permease protein